MPNPIPFLATLTGAWQGTGLNHDSQPYTARLTIAPPINPAAITTHFTATGADGTTYHTETLLISPTAAHSASNNLPGIVPFTVSHPDPDTLILTHGDLTDESTFRETITFHLTGQTLHQTHAWALPTEPLQARSTAPLHRIQSPAP